MWTCWAGKKQRRPRRNKRRQGEPLLTNGWDEGVSKRKCRCLSGCNVVHCFRLYAQDTSSRDVDLGNVDVEFLNYKAWFEKETATCSTHSCCCMCPQLLACRVSRTRWGFGLSLHIAAGSRHDKEAESSFRGTSRESQEETRPSLGLARSESGEL